MSETLNCDDKGVILSCLECGTDNRIGFSKLDAEGRCGSCKAALPKISLPFDMGTSAAFANLVKQSPLPVVVDFWAPWCGPCQMMGPEFSKGAQMTSGQAVFVKVNTEALQDVAGQFRISGIPAFAILKDGQEVARATGARMAAQLVDWLRQNI
ncbi:MAG: thioredoxin [Verrucomicrobiales bacterium]|nr:thioredoxin [Verrucomicrobiales bacterium]